MVDSAVNPRINFQRMYKEPKEPMEQIFRETVMSLYASPDSWDDILAMNMVIAWKFFKLGWNSKRC